MFIIYGTRGVTYCKDRGIFFCPTCAEHNRFRRQRVRRFFTLFFIPMVPLDLLVEYVECQRCFHKFRDDVLELTDAESPASLPV